MLIDRLRQLMYRKEFRIPPPMYPADIRENFSQLEQLITNTDNATDKPVVDSAQTADRSRFLSEIATALWRMRAKMIDPKTDQPMESSRRVYRHLETIWDNLSQEGIEVVEHTSKPFDPGMSIKVLAYQETPGLEKEMIIETIKPTIYNHDKRIQMGEVIVGTPVS